MQETWVRSLGWDNPLEEGMATHSSILAWRIPVEGGAWWAIVHGVTKSQTRLSDFTFTFKVIKTLLANKLFQKLTRCIYGCCWDKAVPFACKWEELGPVHHS